MKNALKISSIIILFLASINAQAVGIGFYGTAYTSGEAEWTRDIFNSTTFTTDIKQQEFGFVMDTTIAHDSLFNYRLQMANVSSTYDGAKYEGYAFNNMFGFGVLKTAALRLWIGPQIGFKRIEAKNRNPGVFITGIDVGAVMGLNFHASRSVSLTAELGHKRGTTYQASSDTDIVIFDIEENRTYINLGILFRFGRDQFE